MYVGESCLGLCVLCVDMYSACVCVYIFYEYCVLVWEYMMSMFKGGFVCVFIWNVSGGVWCK